MILGPGILPEAGGGRKRGVGCWRDDGEGLGEKRKGRTGMQFLTRKGILETQPSL